MTAQLKKLKIGLEDVFTFGVLIITGVTLVFFLVDLGGFGVIIRILFLLIGNFATKKKTCKKSNTNSTNK